MEKFPKVYTFTGRFMVLPQNHVHAYIVELENEVVVVDATLALDSATALREKAESFGKPVTTLLMTHGHPDHYTGLVKFTDVPRYASQGALEFAHREDIAKADTAKGYLGDDFPDVRVFPDKIVADGDTVTVDGVTFTFTDFGPSESDSDGMWSFEKDGVMHAFIGDIIANHTHSFFRDGHAVAWLAVLDRLERELADDAVLYIGHGETPVHKDIIPWMRGYIHAFLEAVDALPNKGDTVSREDQEKVIAAMKDYLPSEATLFLLDYELDVSIPHYWKR